MVSPSAHRRAIRPMPERTVESRRPFVGRLLRLRVDEVELDDGRRTTREVVEHVHDEETNDLIGYFGDDPGDPVIVPAGSIACFSSTLFHRSGPNTTDRMRRVYLAQYSAELILSEDGSRPRHLAVPLNRH